MITDRLPSTSSTDDPTNGSSSPFTVSASSQTEPRCSTCQMSMERLPLPAALVCFDAHTKAPTQMLPVYAWACPQCQQILLYRMTTAEMNQFVASLMVAHPSSMLFPPPTL